MTVEEILKKIKSLGNEKVFAQNFRNGAGAHQYGVKLGDLRKLSQEIGKDHPLALELWNTGNVDARLLSILTMKPNLLSASKLDEMVTSISFVRVADWFNAYVLKDHPEKELLREKWMNSANKWAARSAWSLLAAKIARDAGGLSLEKILDSIEDNMPNVPPEVQWTMNTALAYVGIYHARHRKRAIDIGARLGIYKDYPVSKGCTSPFAPIWINEMVRRQAKAGE